MFDYYLRSFSRLEMETLLKSAKLIIAVDFDNGNIFYVPAHNVIISHIGSILLEEPQIDENGTLIKDSLIDNYWHTNIRTKEELTEEQKQILPLVYPKTPKVLIG